MSFLSIYSSSSCFRGYISGFVAYFKIVCHRSSSAIGSSSVSSSQENEKVVVHLVFSSFIVYNSFKSLHTAVYFSKCCMKSMF